MVTVFVRRTLFDRQQREPADRDAAGKAVADRGHDELRLPVGPVEAQPPDGVPDLGVGETVGDAAPVFLEVRVEEKRE